ncbi:MAG: hypothetical protein QW404_01895 [Candidatus Nanoarchaeia archaeon]
MKKVFLIGIALVLASMMVFAVKPNGPSAVNGLAHPGQASQLYLYEKDPILWEPVIGGAWGKMTFSADNFVFNGHGLGTGVEYTLVRVADPWPQQILCLGTGIVDEYGDIHIQGAWQEGTYPKTWLVLSADTDCTKMIGWHQSEYLFEYALI